MEFVVRGLYVLRSSGEQPLARDVARVMWTSDTRVGYRWLFGREVFDMTYEDFDKMFSRARKPKVK